LQRSLGRECLKVRPAITRVDVHLVSAATWTSAIALAPVSTAVQMPIRSALMIVRGADSVFDGLPPRPDAVSNPPSTPNARDRAIVRRVSDTLANILPVENPDRHEADRTQVVRLDIRLEAMQGMASERQANDGRQSFTDVTVAFIPRQGVVCEIARPERSPNDLVDVDDTGEASVLREHEVADMSSLSHALDEAAILGASRWRVHQVTMEHAAGHSVNTTRVAACSV